MPQNLRFKNAETGEVVVMPWSKKTPPTRVDIEDFKKRRDAELVKPAPTVSIGEKVGSFLYNPLESFPRLRSALSVPQETILKAPLEKSKEEVEKLPLVSRPRTIGKPLWPFKDDRTAEEKAVGEQETRAGRKVQQTLHDVASPENVGITLATMGAGTLPKTAARIIQTAVPAYFTGQIAKEIPSAFGRAYEDPTFENIADVGLLGAGTVLTGLGTGHGIDSFKSKFTPKVEAPAPKTLNSKSQQSLNAKSQLKISTGNKGIIEPDEILSSEYESETGRPISGDYPIKVSVAPEEVASQQLTKGQVLLPRRGEQPVKGKGFTVNAPRIIPTEGPLEIDKTPKVNLTNRLQYRQGEDVGLETKPTGFVAGGRPFPTSESIVEQTPKVEAPKEVKQQVVEPEPAVEPEVNPIENEWMRQQETESLQIMRKGAKGQLANELDTVLAERGIKPPPTINAPKVEITKKVLKSETLEDYNADLERLKFYTGVELPAISKLHGISFKGKAAGKTWEEVTADLIGSGVPEKSANIAANRAFRPGEAGFWNPFAQGAKKLPNKGTKNDVTALSTWLDNWIRSNPDSIVHHGGGSPSAVELARLLKLQRTLANATGGAYKSELAKVGINSERAGVLGLDDEQFGTIPGNVIDVLKNGAMPASPEIKLAADMIKKVDDELVSRASKVGLKQKNSIIDVLDKTRDREDLFNHITNSSKEIVAREILGNKKVNSPLVQGFLNDIKKAGGDRDFGEAYTREVLNNRTGDPFFKTNKVVDDAVSKATTAVFLPFFAISDMLNLGTLAMRGNITRIVPSMIANLKLKNRMSPANIRSGAMEGYITDSLAPQSMISKLYGIRKAEQYLRATAAETGRGTAVDLLEGLKRGQQGEWTYETRYKRLKNLLLKNDKQMQDLVQRGKLSQKEIDTAGGRMAEMTQGLTENVDLPYNWTSSTNPIVNYALSYKRFAYTGTKNLIEAFKEDPVRAGVMLGTVGAALGETIGDTKAAIKGAIASLFTDETTADAVIREIERRGDYLQKSKLFENHPYVARYLTDVIDSWGLGLISDTVMAATTEAGGVAKWAAGPQMSLISEVLYDLGKVPYDIYRNFDKDTWDNVEQVLKDVKNLAPGRLGPAIERSSKE